MFLQANKLTVMRSMVRAVSLPGSLGSFRSSSALADEDDNADDLGGLIYSQHEEVPETRFSEQLRRYRELVRERGRGTRFCGAPSSSGSYSPII